MTTLYKQSVPVFVKYLNNLSGLLKKGQQFADQKGMKHEDLITFRLIPDQRGLDYQVQSCSNTVKFLAVRLGGMENVYLEDNEKTFDELQARIARSISILESLDQKCMDGKEEKELIMETPRMGNFRFTGQSYLTDYAIPNFHFHLTTAYCILRHLGVEVGARDYMNDVFVKVE